jgi:hypothetical protein
MTPDINCDGFDFSLFQQTQYQLIFDRLPHIPFFCHSLVLPEVSMNAARVASPWHDINLSGEKMSFTDLQAEILIDKNLITYTEVFNWLRKLSTLDDIKSDDTSNCTVIVGPLAFVMTGVFPISVSPIQLRSNPTDSDPVTFNVTFNVVSFDIKSSV